MSIIPSTLKIKDDYFYPLFKDLFNFKGINYDRFELLEVVNKYLYGDYQDLTISITSILNGFGFEVELVNSPDLIISSNSVGIIALYPDSMKKDYLNFYVFLGSKDNTLYDFYDSVYRDRFSLTYRELLMRWSGQGIMIEINENFPQIGRNSMLKDDRCDHGISVIMPVYNQSSFLIRAINSLFQQDYKNWELIIINDGSTDNLKDVINGFLSSDRIMYIEQSANIGLGAALNCGIRNSKFNYISYLPADDYFDKTHLSSLMDVLIGTNSNLVYSGVNCFSNKKMDGKYGTFSSGKINSYPLQLVQVLHQKIDKWWVERSEITTDDLDKMYWRHFKIKGLKITPTRAVTATWDDHFYQRHKILNDSKGGGIYLYKKFYKVSGPIKFQSTVGNYIDEIHHFKDFRNIDMAEDRHKTKKLKILIVGELAFNPERIVELEKKGHKLYGLWIENPVNFNTVGPLPFGNIEDIPLNEWRQKIDKIKPDIIYALLNYHAVPLAHHVLTNNPGIPFVWHFKEGPTYCKEFGTWNKLLDLFNKSDGQIFTNKLTKEWFNQFFQDSKKSSYILDGDLPSKHWFTDKRSELLSKKDGSLHTVVAGRPIGLTPENVLILADQNIHLHLYGNIFQNQYKDLITKSRVLAPNHLHLHENCPQEKWVEEFSKYDAGWLHFFKSSNFGDINKATWDDLNFPARMATYAMAGLPMLMKNNDGHKVACQEFLESEGMSLLFNDFNEIDNVIKANSEEVRNNLWRKREIFAFDTYVDDLISFFYKIINLKNNE